MVVRLRSRPLIKNKSFSFYLIIKTKRNLHKLEGFGNKQALSPRVSFLQVHESDTQPVTLLTPPPENSQPPFASHDQVRFLSHTLSLVVDLAQKKKKLIVAFTVIANVLIERPSRKEAYFVLNSNHLDSIGLDFFEGNQNGTSFIEANFGERISRQEQK